VTGASDTDAARPRLSRLADEQAALRRLATLVAAGAPAGDVFAAVAQEVSHVFDLPLVAVSRYEPDRSIVVLATGSDPLFPVGSRWPLDGPSNSATILETGRPARRDDYQGLSGTLAEYARSNGWSSAAGCPIIVAGNVWGLISVVANGPDPLPADTETRLNEFTELVATAIANTESRDLFRGLADEQAALRRVATIVAQGSAAPTLFEAVAIEVAAVVGVTSGSVSRFLPDGSSVVLASHNDPGFPVGSRWQPGEGTLNASVLETGRPVRIDQSQMSGPIADASRRSHVRSVVGVPIVVEGRVWGMVAVGRQHSDEPLPAETEARLAAFTELVATAIANAESHEALAQLADEQAALRRVATLVAQGVPPAELFLAVTREVEREFSGADASLLASVIRFDPGPECVLVGASRPYEGEPIGSRWTPRELYVSTRVLRSGHSARVDAPDLEAFDGPDAEALRLRGFLYQVGSPVVVEGRLWGAMTLNSEQELPPDTDARLENFTELVGTAIANAESREALTRLADEQAALRRVATLVAEGAPAEELFSAVAGEVRQVLGVSGVVLDRYDAAGTTITTLALELEPGWTSGRRGLYVGANFPLEPGSLCAAVHETGRAAQIDDYSDLVGVNGDAARKSGIGSSCGTPIVVDSEPRFRTAPSTGSRTSPRSSPPRSRTSMRETSSTGWPTSKRRCDEWRCAWPATRRRWTSLRPSRRRSASYSTRAACSSPATRRVTTRRSSRGGTRAAETRPSGCASSSAKAVPPISCAGRVARRGSMTMPRARLPRRRRT
jgi:GAF domain-containing protein